MSRSAWCLLVLATSALTGCFAHGEDELRRKILESLHPVGTIGIVSPVVKVYELDAGGMRVLRDAWSEQGRENVTAALETELKAKGFRVKRIEPTAQTREELEEVRLLYQAVGQGILDMRQMHAYYSPNGWYDFDYTVGPMEKVLATQGVDALALAYASDEISTGGRKTKAALAAIVGVNVRSGISWSSVALVNKAGKVLWFWDWASEGGYDLRDPESTRALVTNLVTRMPDEEAAR